jgi:hypothetical protein
MTITISGTSGITQANLGANIAGNGPAFASYSNVSSNCVSAVASIQSNNVELYDLGGCYNNTGSPVTLNGIVGVPAYAFAPNVPGYYQVNGCAVAVVTVGFSITQIQKNGVAYSNSGIGMTNGSSTAASLSSLVYLNGTSDYVQLAVYQQTGGTVGTSANMSNCYFNGFLARAA